MSGRWWVLCSAEPYGFGPISKLESICAELVRDGVGTHLVGFGTSEQFASANARSFSHITSARGHIDWANFAPAHRYNCAISVMDPFLALWATRNQLPCVYVDSLFWMWDWPDGRLVEWEDTYGELLHLSEPEAMRRMSLVPMHESQYLGHRLASVSCVQRAPGADGRAARSTSLGDVRVVEAIVDLAHRSREHPSLWIASTGGLLNELLPLRSAVEWTDVLIRLLDASIDRLGTTSQVLLAGNPTVLALCQRPTHKSIRPRALSHAQMLRELNGAIACLTPPGLTTVLESVAYGTPVIALPAQHYGHVVNYGWLNGHAGVFPGSSTLVSTPGSDQLDVQERTDAVLESLLATHRSGSQGWSELVGQLVEAMQEALGQREQLLERQRDALVGLVGGFSGVQQVLGCVRELFHA